MNKILVGSTKHLELCSNGKLNCVEYLMLNLPFRCNYKCKKCCNRQRETVEEGTPLSIDEITRLIHEAKDLGIRVFVIAGEGEPLLDKNIMQIVREVDKAGLIPYIFTNGSLLDNRTIRYMKEHNASLVINLDSLDRKTYENLSGVEESFEIITKNLDTVRGVFSDTFSEITGHSLRRIAINTVVSQHNINELQNIEDFCGDDFALVYNVPIIIGRAIGNSSFKNLGRIEKKIKN
ncbi:MAG: radical SAM protein, partial [Nanoarchaeota archaeon]|nr:radical SAM protein [Nanoarchaeota archaeon]